MDELLSACPEAVEVLARHGVDPRTRCHRAARGYMTLKQVLGRTCLVDGVKTTFGDGGGIPAMTYPRIKRPEQCAAFRIHSYLCVCHAGAG